MAARSLAVTLLTGSSLVLGFDRESFGHQHDFAEVRSRRELLSQFGAHADSAQSSDLQITASPARPTSDFLNVTVAWTGVTNPQSTDWIAQYCVNASISDFLEWNYVNVDPNWSSGSGSMPFYVFRSNCDYEFRLYRDPSPYTFLGTSNSVSWDNTPDSPFQVHIAYGDDPQTSITVSWTSNVSSADAAAVLQLGTGPGVYNLPNVTADASVTYYANDLCQSPATTVSVDYWVWPGWIHHVRVTGLSAGTRYYARPTQGAAVGDEISFVTGKSVDAEAPTTFAVYAGESRRTTARKALLACRVYAAVVQDSPGVGLPWRLLTRPSIRAGRGRTLPITAARTQQLPARTDAMHSTNAHTAPAPIPADMYVSGIPGAADTSLRISNIIDANPNALDFVLHVGDLGYGEGEVPCAAVSDAD